MAKYLYNGHESPAIPESQYIYATMWGNTLYLLDKTYKRIVGDDGGYCFAINGQKTGETVSGIPYSLSDDGTNWERQRALVQYIEWTDTDASQIFTNTEPIWTNYDLLNEDGSVYLAASDPIPVTIPKWAHMNSFLSGLALGLAGKPLTLAREPVAYLYNGVRLPKLPVVEGYDYAFLEVTFSNGEFWWGHCVLSTKPLEYDRLMSTDYLAATEDCSYVKYTFNEGASQNNIWEWYESGDAAQGDVVNYVTMTVGADCFWANHDIPNITAGGIFLEATEPVPVYE